VTACNAKASGIVLSVSTTQVDLVVPDSQQLREGDHLIMLAAEASE
jgi:hypothetical protein